LAFDERKIVDPYFNKTVMIRGEKAMEHIGGSCRRRAAGGTTYRRRSPIIR
jgi:hypothetical protein